MSDIKVLSFNIPKEALDNVILSWRLSRTEDAYEVLVGQLEKLNSVAKGKLLADILQQDLPIRTFVPVFFAVEGPRSFFDQLDRHSVGVTHWQQSLRVRDLENHFEYFTPPQIKEWSPEDTIYKIFMQKSKDAYIELVKSIPREMARGVIPLHIMVRGSVQCNLRSLLHIISSRTCYFSQGNYWKPVVQGLLEGLWKAIPSLQERNILTLPCTNKNECQFEKDIIDRIIDKSNPICPILIQKFWSQHIIDMGGFTQKQLLREMAARYPNYVYDSQRYCESVGEKINF